MAGPVPDAPAILEIEWAQRFPQFAVSRWLGHSILVSGKHYANSVPDEFFERAMGGAHAAQNAAQLAAEVSGSDTNGETELGEPIGASAGDTGKSGENVNRSGGIRTPNQGIMSPLL